MSHTHTWLVNANTETGEIEARCELKNCGATLDQYEIAYRLDAVSVLSLEALHTATDLLESLLDHVAFLEEVDD